MIASAVGHGGEGHGEPTLTPLEVDPPVEELLQPRFNLDPQIRALLKVHHVAHDALDFVPMGTIICVSVKSFAVL